MDTGLLDTLVKLASIGASGICIFAIFWIGWLILQLPAGADPERHKTLRFFMVISVAIAVISAATGILNAMFNRDAIVKAVGEKATAEEEKAKVVGEVQTLQGKIAAYEKKEGKALQASKALEVVLQSKEAANLRNPSEEIKDHIKMLKTLLADLGESKSPHD